MRLGIGLRPVCALLACVALLIGVAPASGQDPPSSWEANVSPFPLPGMATRGPGYSVTPILFIPTPSSFPVGYQPTEAELATDFRDVTEAMGRIRTWYGKALGLTASFNLQPTVRMDALHGLSAYGITWSNPANRYTDGIQLGDMWGLVLTEVDARGHGAGSPSQPQLNIIFCKGAGGFAGGAQWFDDPGGGNCILGDWCLDSLADRVPPQYWTWWTGKDLQTGASAHEMGHCWGLAHTDDITNPVTHQYDSPYTVMYYWWTWPNYPVNPADPSWPLRGLHAWARDLGPGGARYASYQDAFTLTYRAPWFGVPTSSYLGDVNCDGHVDFDDINPFVLALVDHAAYGSAYPACNLYNADCNGDGVVDFNDINPFVACLVSGGCP